MTGDSQLGATPSPDRSRVKSVFPWEEKPRVMPARIFPESDAPPPSLFLSPSSQSQASTTTVPSTPETKGQPRAMQLSPLYGLPTSFNYGNAWDNIPSIQKYASRLVRAPPPPPPLAPAFEDSHKRGRRKNLDERGERSSDGDDEDNADEEDDVATKAAGDKWDDNDIDEETSRRRSRSNSVMSAATRHKVKKKEYKHRGVQTMTIETRSQGVQVDRPSRSERERHGAKLLSLSGNSGKRHWAPPMGSTVLPLTLTRDVSSSSSSDNGVFAAESMQKSPPVSPSLRPHRDFVVAPPSSVSPLAKPRTKSDPPTVSSKSLLSRTSTPSSATPVLSSVIPTQSATQPTPLVKSPPPKSSIITRQLSNDPSVSSPASSIGPLSPSPVSLLSPMRKPGRVWDPARGVELFKRGSEEVLARFLKMGSWEEEGGGLPQR